jgi:hypothetical protein
MLIGNSKDRGSDDRVLISYPAGSNRMGSESIVEAIDREIANLTQARAVLIGSAESGVGQSGLKASES